MVGLHQQGPDLAESSHSVLDYFDLEAVIVDHVGGASQLAPPSLVVSEVLLQEWEMVTFVYM